MNDDVKDEDLTLEKRIEEVRERLKLLESSLPRQIDPIGISRTKLPFKVLNYREALIWRMNELGKVAFQAFQAEQFAAAVVLTRAAVEKNSGRTSTFACRWLKFSCRGWRSEQRICRC